MAHYTQFAKDFTYNLHPVPEAYAVYPDSVRIVGKGLVYMADAGDEDVIVAKNVSGFAGEIHDGVVVAPLIHENALRLRALFPFTAPVKVLSRDQSCGVGDRLGIAAPGHIRVFQRCGAVPILAQQSMRELSLTNRTYEDVIDAATFAVYQTGFRGGFGADGDHLKTYADIEAALKAGCTMITLDCSDHIKPPRPLEPDPVMEEAYLNRSFFIEDEEISFSVQDLADARAIYGGAIAFAKDVFERYFAGENPAAELEISIDETSEPTTPAQHFFIAAQLRSLGVDFVTLAPRFIGEFQKGVDYIGDLAAFERDFKVHAAIARHFGYKLSIHSGSDKFSVFPIIGKHTRGKFHLKTAGTNWLEAMRVVAKEAPGLYREAHQLALDSFEAASKYYHVTTDLSKIPPLSRLHDDELPSLFDQNDPRQLIHITYGFLLGDESLRKRLYSLWRKEREAYAVALKRHIARHIALITGKTLRG